MNQSLNIKEFTIRDVLAGFKNNDFSAEELHREFLKLIKEEDNKLNAYLEVFDEQEERVTRQSSPGVGDAPLRELGVPQPRTNQQIEHGGGEEGQDPLQGVPCAIKDNILIEDTRCTAGSKILENYIAPYDATVIKKLRAAGAVFLGKTNLDEFAMGSSTENSAFGPTKNPHDLTRVPGGSSGGSAAAVASGLAIFALGSDTGGSIRLPSSFCGVVGLKPTYGRVSRHGLMAMASSLDQIGPITKNVYDAALVLNTISGRDPFDSTSSPEKVPDYTQELDKPIRGLKIGVPKEFFAEGLDQGVAQRIEKAISKMQSLGAEIIDVSLPHLGYSLAVYYIIMPCEVSTNLARYDGIKYGYSEIKNQKSKIKSLMDIYLKSRRHGFGEEPRRRIMLGTYALSAGYYDAYYKKAVQVRALIIKDFDEAFNKVDVLFGPTAPDVAFKIGEKTGDPLSMYLADIYTVAVNLAGVPAISIPCGFAGAGKDGVNLPVGLQIIGKHFDEAAILKTAYHLENN